MSLTAAELKAILTLDKSQFERGLSQAESTAQRSSGKFKQWSGGVARAASDGLVLAAAGAAAMAVKVTTVGVEYNALQQQSRAALTTILDGSEAANAQMDKLDEFAKNSPFARDVFIKAQQQLLGFGMEAERVVPTLSAIEDAVAAVGGSNEDIAEIANVLAKVEGTGKITARTLNELGIRGIDAATIIGEQMGKTGNQIRDEITDGSLDAGEAMEALTAGMTENFGGAAAAVKETWMGATDRIKAATRDIGSEIAKPFVDPMGGGRAIEWANLFADVLRAVERQLPDFVSAMDNKLSPAFDRFSLAMKDTADGIDQWDSEEFITTLSEMGRHTPAIAGLSGAMLTMATANIPVIGGLAKALGPIPVALGAAALASPGMRDGLKELMEAGEPLVSVLGDLAEMASTTFSAGLEVAGGALGVVADIVGPVVEWFSELPEPMRNAATAAIIFGAAGRPLAGKLGGIATGIRNTVGQFGGWGGAFSGATGSLGDFRAGVGLATESIGRSAMRGLRGAGSGLVSFLGGPWGIALMGATALITLWANEQKAARERATELTESLDEQTGAFTAASDEVLVQQLRNEELSRTQEDLIEGAERYGIASGDLVGYLQGEEEATKRVEEAIKEYNSQSTENLDLQELGIVKSTEFTDSIAGMREETLAVIEAREEELQALKELEQQLDEGERSYARMTEAMGVAVDETVNMNDRVAALNDALDELNGVTRSQEEADRELANSQRDLGKFFEDNAEDIEDMDEALVDMATGMPSHTELGNDLNRMLEGMGDEAKEAALRARDEAEARGESSEATQAAMRDAYKPYIDTLADLAEQGFLTEDEVAALTKTILGVPEITAFLVTHEDSVTETGKDVLNLINEIYSIPDGDTYISDNATSKEVVKELEALGIEVEHLPDGTVKVKTSGIPDVNSALDRLVGRKLSIDIPVTFTQTERLEHMARTGHPALGRARGGIDTFKGMEEGGITNDQVMKVAEMVPPGVIRFAGDRTDVDEAWIPLDGSPRSRAILAEANERMPGEGMAKGGITGTFTPPEIEAVGAPDTKELQDVWSDTMEALEASTRDSMNTIESDTADAQEASTASTKSNLGMMRDITGTQLALMVRSTSDNMSTMDRDTSRHTQSMQREVEGQFRTMDRDTSTRTSNMRSTANQQFSNMESETSRHTSTMRATTSDQFARMQQRGSQESTRLRDNTTSQFRSLHDNASREARGLRSDSNREFTSMRTHGVSAASDLRTGVVDQVGRARNPFTSRVNNLVSVMQDFSKAMNDAYGDMGIKVGSPRSISAWTGGILPGYNPGVDNHTFLSPTGGRLNLSGGEGVSRPEVVEGMGRGAFNALNAAARSGGVPGVRRALHGIMPVQSFSTGGIMDEFTADAKKIGTEFKGKLSDDWVRPMGRSIIDEVVEGIEGALEASMSGVGWVRPTTGRITSRYGAGRGRYPHAGMDIAAGHGTPVVAPTAMRILETGTNIGPGRTGEGILGELMDGMYSYFGHNPLGGIRVRPGDLVTPGQRIGAQGNTGNSTGAHLHWEIHRGRPWADINPHPYWEAAGGGGGGTIASAGGGSDRWEGVIRQALRLNGLPTTSTYVNAWLRQVQTESGGNPRIIQQISDINSRMGNHARGLLQVIPPTFRAYSLPGMKDIFNPLHNAAAGMSYAKSRYGVAGMLRAIGRGRGYKHGTESALPGWAWVGEDGPELMNMQGGEKVMPHAESVAATSSLQLTQQDADLLGKAIAKHMPQGGLTIGDLYAQDPQSVADEVIRKIKVQQSMSAPVPRLA